MQLPARRHGASDGIRTAIMEMTEALEIERDEYRNRRRVERIDLGPGQRIPDRVPAAYRYRKQRPKVLPYPPGMSVVLTFADGTEEQAVVLSQTRGTIDVRMQDRGSQTPEAAIHWDPAWLLDELARNTKSHISTHITRAILGHGISEPRSHDPLLLAHASLDEEQRRALDSIVSSSCMLLEGPAGTGKTRLLIALVEELRARKESILIVAPSHAACDVLTERLLDLTEGADGPGLGKVVRWGTVQSARLRRHAATDRRSHRRDGMWFHDGADVEAARAAAHEADILITTTARAFVGNGLLRVFGTVIVDEAGMCSVPAVLSALRYAVHRGVVAGDARQLGPIVHTRGDRLVDRWLRRNAFDRADELGTLPRVRLTTQYRMAARITSVVSDFAYDGRIVASPSLATRPVDPCPLGSDQLYLIDTSGVARSGVSRFSNPAHARIIAALVTAIDQPLAQGQPNALVLARYRAQVAKITEECRAAQCSRRGLLVSTVHSAQGSEAPTVIVDLIPGTADYLGDYLVDRHPTDEGARILTVAVSRARHRLIVVADLNFLLSRLPERARARRLIELLQAEATILSARDVEALRATPLIRLAPAMG